MGNVQGIIWKRYVGSSGGLVSTPPDITGWVSREEFLSFARLSASEEPVRVSGAIAVATAFLERIGYYIRPAQVIIRKEIRDFLENEGGYFPYPYMDNTIAPITSAALLQFNEAPTSAGNTAIINDISLEHTYFNSYKPFISTSGFYNMKFEVGAQAPEIDPIAKEAVLRLFTAHFQSRSLYEAKGRESVRSILGTDIMQILLP